MAFFVLVRAGGMNCASQSASGASEAAGKCTFESSVSSEEGSLREQHLHPNPDPNPANSHFDSRPKKNLGPTRRDHKPQVNQAKAIGNELRANFVRCETDARAHRIANGCREIGCDEKFAHAERFDTVPPLAPALSQGLQCFHD